MKTRIEVYTILFLSAAIGLGALFSVGEAGQQSSANYTIEKDVLSCGGGDMGSAHYVVLSTAGQPSAIGNSSCRSYAHIAGFWHWIEVPPKGKAMPWIHLLLLGD